MRKLLVASIIVAGLASSASVAMADDSVSGLPKSEAASIAQAQDQADGLVPAGPSVANPINFHDANLDVRGDQ